MVAGPEDHQREPQILWWYASRVLAPGVLLPPLWLNGDTGEHDGVGRTGITEDQIKSDKPSNIGVHYYLLSLPGVMRKRPWTNEGYHTLSGLQLVFCCSSCLPSKKFPPLNVSHLPAVHNCGSLVHSSYSNFSPSCLFNLLFGDVLIMDSHHLLCWVCMEHIHKLWRACVDFYLGKQSWITAPFLCN